MIRLGVDNIGSVIQHASSIKNQALKETVDLVKSDGADSGRESSIIPLFSDLTAIFEVINYYDPDIIHFCETVTTAAMDQLIKTQQQVRKHFPDVKIMRSIPIRQPGFGGSALTLQIAEKFEPYSDLFLTDTLITNTGSENSPAPAEQPVEGFVGITGETCDWDIARDLVAKSKIPVILAGGISVDNVFKGISCVKPFGVDSCTRTNALDSKGQAIRFKKDLEKVKKLVQNVREAEQMV